jgi:hypothetical protein
MNEFFRIGWLVLRSQKGQILDKIPMLGPMLGWMLAQEAKYVTVEFGKFLAYRLLFIVLVWTLGPLAIFETLRLLFQHLLPIILAQLESTMQDKLGNNVSSQVVSLYGAGAWIANLMRISEGLTIYFTWMMLKFTWKMLPKPLGIGR